MHPPARRGLAVLHRHLGAGESLDRRPAPAREHPRKVVRVAPDGKHAISYITERGVDVAPTNRQSYAEAYNRQSLPIVSRRDTVLKLGSQTGEVVLFHVVPQETALDIDTDFDFRMVETLLLEREREAGRTT